MDTDTIVIYGSLASLLVLGLLMFLAQEQHRKYMRRMRTASDRITKLTGLIRTLKEEKAKFAASARDKVEKSALKIVMDETAGTLGKALDDRRVKAVATSGGGKRVVR